MTREEISKKIAAIERRIAALLEEVQGVPGGVGVVGESNAAAVMFLDQERWALKRQLRSIEE